MAYLVTNNASTTLSSGITNVATTITLTDASLFPVVNNGGTGSDYAIITLENTSNVREIIKVTRRDTGSNALTVVRGQEGTTALAWLAGDTASLRLSAGEISKFVSQQALQQNLALISNAGGTADAITGTYTPAITTLTNGTSVYVRAAYANATSTPTFSPNGLTAATIYKGAGGALAAGDIAGAGHWIELQYDTTLAGWVLLNPAKSVSSSGGTGSGTTGGGTDQAFLESDVLINSSYTVGASAQKQVGSISIATPCVVTLTAHGFSAGQPITFSTTGALPTGLDSVTTFYVSSASLGANSFQIAATQANAIAGTSSIATSGTQSGVQSCGKVKNASSVGPLTVGTGAVVTVLSGSTWTIV